MELNLIKKNTMPNMQNNPNNLYSYNFNQTWQNMQPQAKLINTNMNNMLNILISKTLVNTNSNNNGILKFLSRPIVTIAKKEQIELDKSTKIYEEADFVNFYYEISELVQKDEKRENEKKLISLSNHHLKELL